MNCDFLDDTIEIANLQAQINNMKAKQKYLKQHPYKIWQKNNGRWVTYFPDARKGRIQRERSTKEEVEALIVEYWREQEVNPTIAEIFTEWNDRRLELKKISPATHMRNVQTFNRHYSEFGYKHIKNVSPEEFQDFLEEQVPKYELSAKAFSNLKGITRGFLKWAKRRKLISYEVEPVFQELDISRDDFESTIHEDREEVFNEEETPVIVNYLLNNLDMMNAAILLMFVTGLRIGEVVTLKHPDVHDDSVDVRRTETRYRTAEGHYVCDVKEFPKTKAGIRTVVIPAQFKWLLPRLNAYNQESEWVFVSSRTYERLNSNSIRKRLKRICGELEIYPKSPHKIRKTYSSILLDNGVDECLVTSQMGHTNISCDEIHYHRNRRNIDKKQKILSDIPDFNAMQDDVQYDVTQTMNQSKFNPNQSKSISYFV